MFTLEQMLGEGYVQSYHYGADYRGPGTPSVYHITLHHRTLKPFYAIGAGETEAACLEELGRSVERCRSLVDQRKEQE